MAPASQNLESLARQAVAFHQQGKLDEAEKLYLQILEAEPGLFGPLNHLGLIRLQQGRNAEAAEFLAKALKIMPNDLGALVNCGMALRAVGRPAEALTLFDEALKIQPNIPEALYNRGVVLNDLQRYEDAIEANDRVLVLRPDFAAAFINRGVALAAVNRLDDALASYDRALALQPGNAMALNARGLALRALRRPPEALENFERALAADPGFADARYNRAVALLQLQRFADALADFETVMAARPNDAELLNNRGVTLWNLKRPAEALASFDRALAIEPGFAEVWGNRGLALRDLARFEEALASYDHLLKLQPQNPVAWNSRGTVLRDMKRFDEAVESYGRAIEIRPGYAEALNNRGYTLWADKHDYAPALADLERALVLDPDHPYARGEILHMKMYGADWAGFDKLKAEIETGIRLGQRVARPFMFQAVSQNPEDLQACSRIWARDLYFEVADVPRHDPALRKDRKKIRIGYVSGEFREQATAILMAGLYEQHDREKFEVIALDNTGAASGAMRQRLEKAFDRMIDISVLSDEAAAARIRAEEIDILVNLNGYFGKPRMGVFARRPAPIQVNYLGFPATLGASYIDYILADGIVIPPGEEKFYDEQVVRLPASYQANDNKGRAIGAAPSRAEAGLPATGFVFANFNNSYKLTPDVFAGWMRILKASEGSVLWLLEARPPFAENLARQAKAQGVDPARIVYAPDLPPQQHLARLGLADLFLDTLPYNAHTTASDALWAGVPLLTLRGTTFPGRVAASLLTAAGMPELVTETQADYEALAVTLAGDAKALAALKVKLAQNRDTCALFDTETFARHIESAYARMWQRWLDGERSQGFAVAGEK
jgi:predicted O-linked N-acetylglucosamine transferase (SPINDLY family)